MSEHSDRLTRVGDGSLIAINLTGKLASLGGFIGVVFAFVIWSLTGGASNSARSRDIWSMGVLQVSAVALAMGIMMLIFVNVVARMMDK